MKIQVLPIVRPISNTTFQSLLAQELSDKDREIVLRFIRDQGKYKLLTKKKYAYFWTIYNKYLPPEILEYPDTVKVKEKFIPKSLTNLKFGKTKEQDASKKRWNDIY